MTHALMSFVPRVSTSLPWSQKFFGLIHTPDYRQVRQILHHCQRNAAWSAYERGITDSQDISMGSSSIPSEWRPCCVRWKDMVFLHNENAQPTDNVTCIGRSNPHVEPQRFGAKLPSGWAWGTGHWWSINLWRVNDLGQAQRWTKLPEASALNGLGAVLCYLSSFDLIPLP